MGNVLVISTSLRAKSNSDILAERLIAGARDAGHAVEHVSLKGKTIRFCIGCLACQKTQQCALKDDAVGIAEKVKNADTLVFATPIYYYGMSGQMKEGVVVKDHHPLFRKGDHQVLAAQLFLEAVGGLSQLVDGLGGHAETIAKLFGIRLEKGYPFVCKEVVFFRIDHNRDACTVGDLKQVLDDGR